MISKDQRTSAIRVRRAVPTDLDCIDDIERQSFSDPYPPAFLRYLYHTPSSIVLVAETHMIVVGFVIASAHHDLGHIISIATHPIERRKTIGRTLMTAVLAILNTRSVTTVRLEVRQSNVEAQRFYEQFGFQLSHRIASYYGDEDALVYMKQLR
jgi:ribosomal-protein-alanine N-acetyltransferase